MTNYKNPFPKDTDRSQIWEMLVERDIRAFIQVDWRAIENDFLEEEFIGVDAEKKENPDFWNLKYPTLESYKKEWIRQAIHFRNSEYKEDPEQALYDATQMRDMDISGSVALVHKKFDGSIKTSSGSETLNWQTLYRCRKVKGVWKIVGFTGYMPYKLNTGSIRPNQIVLPQSSQHKTAGPYSPVLEIQTNKLVVISGQAAIDPEGNIVGDTIEEQTKVTLENCKHQLRNAGVSLNDVFKVNVYLTDLDLWPRFNEVYKTYFEDPLPARAAVGVNLLMTLLVEIEMWAIKS